MPTKRTPPRIPSRASAALRRALAIDPAVCTCGDPRDCPIHCPGPILFPPARIGWAAELAARGDSNPFKIDAEPVDGSESLADWRSR